MRNKCIGRPVERVVMKPLNAAHLSVDEHRTLFTTAGYEDVQIFENRSRGWICALGRRVDSGRFTSQRVENDVSDRGQHE